MTQDAEILALRRARSEAVADVGAAMWAALDVVKAHLGGFKNWPPALQEAFSKAIIDPNQRLTTAEIKHAQKLAAEHGWERADGVDSGYRESSAPVLP